MTSLTITPDTDFSLQAAASFGFGPHTGRPKPQGSAMRLAFVTDDLQHQVGVGLRQVPGGELVGEVHGDPGAGDVLGQVRRILCLDRPGEPWLAVGARDPVIGALQRSLPGLRPVLFHSPYEAAAWSVLALRRHRSQAAAMRTRLAERYGRNFHVDGETISAFPLPEKLLQVEAVPGLDQTRISRLHAVAEAALNGGLDADRLRQMDPEAALREVQRLPGLGPTYAQLVLLRATGACDVMTFREPRIPYYVAHFYGMSHPCASEAELTALSAVWRPFRTWTCVLLRVAGDRLSVPHSPTAARPGGSGR